MYLKALFFSKWAKRDQITKIINQGKLNIDIVDWGPGGGANMLAFAKNIRGNYYGVDISEKNLEECNTIAVNANIKNFYGILINIANPEKVYKKIEKCHLFICTAVFPHLPHKDYAERITKIARDLLIKDGIAIFHVLLGKRRRIFHIGSYNSQVHSNTIFTYEEYIQILKKNNLKLMYVIKDFVNAYSYFIVVKSNIIGLKSIWKKF